MSAIGSGEEAEEVLVLVERRIYHIFDIDRYLCEIGSNRSVYSVKLPDFAPE